MANRSATSTDVSNHAAWCAANIDGNAVTQFDMLFDAYTNVTPKYIFLNTLDESTLFSEDLTGAASGNNNDDTDFVCSGAIDTDRPSVGAFKVADGSGGWDAYKYSSFTGSTFTLDSTAHPDGLDRTYGGSEQVWSPKLRLGATMWLSSDTFDADISALLVSFGETSLHLFTEAAPMYIRPLNGRIKFIRLNSESTNACIEIQDINYCIIDGELRATYPGFRHGITNIYCWNQFGFWLTDSELDRNVRMCSIDSTYLKGAGFIGIAVFHGFAGFRAARSNDNQQLDFLILKRCLSTFGLGERTYFLQTTDNAANPIVRRCEIKDNVFAYAGNEGFQVQNISSKGGASYIKNFVAFANALMWKHAFQNNQDTGIQWEIQDADNGNYLGDGIVEGWGTSGLQVFSSDKTARGYAAGSEVAKINNILLTGGRQFGLRKHGSTADGPVLEWRDIYVKDINDTIDELSVEDELDYWMESADESVNSHMINITYESGKSDFFADSGASQDFDSTYSTGLAINDSLADTAYINNGFDGINVEKFEVWNDVATQDTDDPAITYTLGDYVINAVTDGEYAFYYVRATHAASAGTTNRPDNDATNFLKLTWDESGVRSNAAGWTSGDDQSDYPPCDFRLVADSFWANKGMGLSFNPPRTDRTIYQWEYSTNNSTWYTIAGAQGYTLTVADYDYLAAGYYIRLKRNGVVSLSTEIT